MLSMTAARSTPTINRQMLGGFRWFVRRYLKRHFHAVAVNRSQLSATSFAASDSLIFYANHASWWDPLTAIYLAEKVFPNYPMYAPIDAQALQKYRMFARMGFFGVEQNSRRGAADFLEVAQSVLAQPSVSLWLTPEGRFADVRDNTAQLMPGLAHLASRLAKHGPQRIWFVPGAVEYTFWEERKPELLIWFGKPLFVASIPQATKSAWADELTGRLRDAQGQLAQASIARNAEAFEVLSGGRTGSFFIYDLWRKMTGWACGRPVEVEHSGKFKS